MLISISERDASCQGLMKAFVSAECQTYEMECFKRNGLQLVTIEKDYQSLEKAFILLVAFIDQTKKLEVTERMTSIHTR